jgi:hypothetical protein
MVEKRTLKAAVAQARPRIRPYLYRRRACPRDPNENHAMLIISFLAILVLLFLLTGVRIANQYERAVIFRLGKYARTS